jgi:hypothetical protein
VYDCSTDSRIKRPNHNTPTEIIDSIKIEVATTFVERSGETLQAEHTPPLTIYPSHTHNLPEAA